MSLLFEFLEFIEAAPSPGLHDLLERVLYKSRKLTGAEAGSIFIVRRQGRRKVLQCVSVQNERLVVALEPFTLPFDRSSIAGYVAETGKTVRLADVRHISARAPYRFNEEADRAAGFHTRSLLSFPLRNHAGQVIGVVQLINRRGARGEPIPFTAEQGALIRPIDHFLGGAVERVDMLERISMQNRRLAARSRALASQRQRIAALKDQTEDAFQLSIRLLARAAELHDQDTGNHITRVNEYSYMIATRLGLPRDFCDEIRYSAQLHDVGKMAVDQAVLKKRGSLTPEERAEMDRHPEYGYRILIASDRLKMAAAIARCHHENWNGTGYPHGLKGEAIPLAARIVQMADVYDALRAARPYKPGLSHAAACRIMLEGDGRIDPKGHFDPRLIALFAAHHSEMERIWLRFAD